MGPCCTGDCATRDANRKIATTLSATVLGSALLARRKRAKSAVAPVAPAAPSRAPSRAITPRPRPTRHPTSKHLIRLCIYEAPGICHILNHPSISPNLERSRISRLLLVFIIGVKVGRVFACQQGPDEAPAWLVYRKLSTYQQQKLQGVQSRTRT